MDSGEKQMRPVMIIPKGSMSSEDIARLNENLLCVVESADPAGVNFLDPLPALSQRTEIEEAAIQLSRRLLSMRGNIGSDEIQKMFVQLLLQGTRLHVESPAAKTPKKSPGP